MDAVEEVLRDEPVDEILLAVATHGLSRRLHLDLAHRLTHLGLPITTVGARRDSRSRRAGARAPDRAPASSFGTAERRRDGAICVRVP